MKTVERAKPEQRDNRVLLWRVQTLERAGFDARETVLLANDPDVDLHDAVRLVESGCPLRIAADILL